MGRRTTRPKGKGRPPAPTAARITEGRRPAEGGPLSDILAAVGVDGRMPVNEATALNLSAVWAAVRIVSGGVSILPLHVYERSADGGRKQVLEDAAARIAAQPCPEMTAATFWETLTAHMVTWGNGYAEIERNGLGEPIALWPLLPDRTRPRRGEDGRLVYEVTDGGRTETLRAEDVFHVPGLGFDGLKGYSVISMARRSLGLTASAEAAGESFFSEGMRPSGYLKYPGSLDDLKKLNLDENLKKKHGGASRFGKTLLLYGGLEYASLGIPPEDAQFLEQRQFQVVEVARWFNVPPHMIRDLSRATFSNIENQSADFVTFSLLYWLNKIAQEFNRRVLGGSPRVYAEHLVDAFLRADTAARFDAHTKGISYGVTTPNEARKKENLPPMPGGDRLWLAANLAPLDGPRPDPTQAKPDKGAT